MTAKKKEFLFYFILVLGTIILCLMLIETSLRILGINGPKPYTSGEVRHTKFNPFLIFGPNVNVCRDQKYSQPACFNSQGFRKDKVIPLEKKENEYRIFALGGSTTENLANGHNIDYCRVFNNYALNKILHGKELVCINAAKSGYSSAHTLIRLQFDLLKFKPDMITVMHNINDLTVNFYPRDENNNYANKFLGERYAPQPLGAIDKYLLRYHCYQFFKKILNKLEDKLLNKKNQVYLGEDELFAKENFTNNLLSVIQIARTHNIEVVLLTQPVNKSKAGQAVYVENENMLPVSFDIFLRSFLEYNAAIKNLAEKEQVYLIDMQREMSDQKEYFTDVVHFSKKGIIKFGDIYFNKIYDLLKRGY